MQSLVSLKVFSKVGFMLLSLNMLIPEAFSQVRLHKLFSDNMVLQRDKPVKVFGWASPGEKVTVLFRGQKVSCPANSRGKWLIELKPIKYGGPFKMQIKGNGKIIDLKNILVGDVWLCSGQSNMEWTVKRVKNAKKEIASANFPYIRLLNVPQNISNKPKEDIPDVKWQVCTPETVQEFSAVGYFFGRSIHRRYKIPIGLINSTWGGTNIETWMSRSSVSGFHEYQRALLTLDAPELDTIEKAYANLYKKWFHDLKTKDRGFVEKWYSPSYNSSGWSKIELPALLDTGKFKGADGIIWARKEFNLTREEAGDKISIHLGPIDEYDDTYLNGHYIGRTTLYSKARIYKADPDLLKTGRNILAVRVTDIYGTCGFNGKASQMFVKTDEKRISIAGKWDYEVGINNPSYIKTMNPNNFPTIAYNAMINPLTSIKIKGVIWYQGESNDVNAYRYRFLFPDLIKDWRNKWNSGDLPFLYVQLPNFGKSAIEPADSKWAVIRESQAAGLALPETAMAVTLDIGDTNDIHPRNKQDVAYRLSLLARHKIYNENIISEGPFYKSMKIEKDSIVLSFSHIGSGLLSSDKSKYLNGFEIAGDNKEFTWAKAFIKGDKVIVYNAGIRHPKAVRYAWSSNPGKINFYNKEGLPAAPFRTDSWKLITQDNE